MQPTDEAPFRVIVVQPPPRPATRSKAMGVASVKPLVAGDRVQVPYDPDDPAHVVMRSGVLIRPGDGTWERAPAIGA